MFGLSDIISGAGLVANIFGSGKEKVNTTPTDGYETLPQYLKDAYEKVYYPKVMEQFDKPFQMEPTVRYQETDPLFRSQAVSNYQALSDEVGGLFPAFKAPAQQAAEQEAAAAEQASMRPAVDSQASEVALRRALATDPNDMSNDAKAKRQQLYKMNVALQNFQDGQVNPVTGEKFDRGGFLDFLQRQEDQRTMFPSVGIGSATGGRSIDEYKAFMDEGDKYHYQTFIPSKSKQSFLGRFGAPLMLAAMTGGIGMGANALAAPAMAGGLSPVTASNIFKGITTVARGAAGK